MLTWIVKLEHFSSLSPGPTQRSYIYVEPPRRHEHAGRWGRERPPFSQRSRFIHSTQISSWEVCFSLVHTELEKFCGILQWRQFRERSKRGGLDPRDQQQEIQTQMTKFQGRAPVGLPPAHSHQHHTVQLKCTSRPEPSYNPLRLIRQSLLLLNSNQYSKNKVKIMQKR